MNDEYRSYWNRAFRWGDYRQNEIEKHRELWEGVYRKAVVPQWAIERASALEGAWKLLVVGEDWCGDASNTIPVLARLAEAAVRVDLRILKRDENLELMDRWLTNGTRSIPLAIVLDEDFEPAGSWGPRPRQLQESVLSEKRKGARPSAEIYRDARWWYARDRGETTLRELLNVLERAAARRAGRAASVAAA